ncbi:MAG TPA: hypothetical protein PKC26_04715, partial [Plasticicumulans sp.]|nr:hypothetical protein [Plasticicumulans sp.]
MSTLHSSLNPRAGEFRRNAEAMAALVADLRAQVADIARVYGETLTDNEALKVIALSGAKNVGVKAVGEAAAYVPIVGWIARPALFAAS